MRGEVHLAGADRPVHLPWRRRDDAVVLLEAFRSARETIRDGGSVRERFEFVAERAGVSIAITSITNFLAFALGSLTVIPAVSWFCLYAPVTILCDFAIAASFFLAVLALLEAADQNAEGRSALRRRRRRDPAAPAEQDGGAARAAARCRAQARGDDDDEDDERKRLERVERRVGPRRPRLRRVPDAHFCARRGSPGVRRVRRGGVSERGLRGRGSAAHGRRAGRLVSAGVLFQVRRVAARVANRIALEHHFQGFRHETPQAQARVFAAWGVFLGSPYVEAVAAYASEDGASPASNWLAAAVAAANATAPCASLGVAAEVCALAAVPFGGLEVTGPGRPGPDSRNVFHGRAERCGGGSAGNSRRVRRPPDASSISGLGAAGGLRSRHARAAGGGRLPHAAPHLRGHDSVRRGNSLDVRSGIERGVEAVAARTDVVVGTRVDDSVDDSVGATTVPIVASVASTAPAMFTFSENLVYWQQDAVLWNELVVNLSLAGTGVFIVCVLALAHPRLWWRWRGSASWTCSSSPRS